MPQPGAKAKILMLHGHAESGPCFKTKTKRLAEHLDKIFPAAPSANAHPSFPGGIELFYPTGPLRITPADLTQTGADDVDINPKNDLDAWAWGNGDFRKADPIEGLAESVPYMLEYMQENGPFVGVIGFSCGATLAAILASLLEGDKNVTAFNMPANFAHPPLHFAVCYSGFMLKYPNYRPCYSPRIRTPIIHVIGKYDPMTEESSTLALARRCSNSAVIYHPGSHYVPTKQFFLERVAAFVDVALGRGESDDEEDEWVDI